jgi:hypothetical protein
MKLLVKHFKAEVIPVISCVEQVEMPRLVYFF